MSVVRVAVPVLEGRRRFFYDKGRPWSLLEHLLLAALAVRSATASELAKSGDINQRVVVEALIRLMRAGWLEMVPKPNGVIFQITRSGLAAVVADALPSASRRLNRKINFVVEQLTGAVFRTREFPFLHKHVVTERAAREPVVWLERPPNPIHDQIRPLVDALFLDDEKFVAMDATGERLAERWSLVTVKDGAVDGLPARTPQVLIDEILRAALDAPKTPQDGVTVRPIVHQAVTEVALPQRHRIVFSFSDLILGAKEHKDVLWNMVRRARHRVIIHSTFIDQSRFEDLLPAFRTAIDQGATIDILWGQDEDAIGVRATRQVVGQLQKRLESDKVDRLRLHPFSTGSHSKILIADDGDPNRLTACIGSCNWLSTGFESFEASVRVRDPRVVADLLEELGELSRGGNGNWVSLTSDLVAMASRQRSRPVTGPGRADVTILLAPQHAEVMRRARDEATARIFVASHRWGVAGQNIALTPILVAAQEKQVAVTAYYGIPSKPMTGERAATITREASHSGVTIRPVHKPRLHAKLLAWDDNTIVITSQNWLSADPPDSRPRQEIGILVEATGIARMLIERFEATRLD